MSVWLAASIALVVGFVACAIASLHRQAVAALAALNLVSMIATLSLITMTVAFERQPFVDLAVVLAPLSIAGSLAFVRYLERRQ